MSELQTEATEAIDSNIEPVEAEATGTEEVGAELAPASEEKHEEKQGVDQDAVNKAINKKHYQMKEAQREAEAARKEAEELKAKLQTLEVGQEPSVPPIPDPYDDDYEAKVKARDDAILRKAEFDAGQKIIADQKAAAQKQAEEAEAKRVDSMVSSYMGNATKLGLNAAEVEKAGDVLVNNGVSQDVALFLLDDAEGPLMTQYLANNPIELDELASMPPMKAAIHLNSVIREKSSSLKPQVTNAPEPAEVLGGNGAPEETRPNITGATFE